MSDFVPTPFAVIKFLPDPIRDEPINVGIIGTVEGQLEGRLLSSFGQLRSRLPSEDLKSLELALRFLRSSIDRSPDLSLARLVETQSGQVTFSALMGGLTEDPSSFLDDQFEIYVKSAEVPHRAELGESRTQIRNRIRKFISAIGRDSEPFAIAKKPVRGKYGTHSFDFGFLNGKVTLVQAISFQTQEQYALGEAKILTLSAIDTRERLGDDVDVLAVVSPPREATPYYDEARRILQSKTTIVDLDSQAEAMVDNIFASDVTVRALPSDYFALAS
jgi:DUF3037 family protein